MPKKATICAMSCAIIVRAKEGGGGGRGEALARVFAQRGGVGSRRPTHRVRSVLRLVQLILLFQVVAGVGGGRRRGGVATTVLKRARGGRGRRGNVRCSGAGEGRDAGGGEKKAGEEAGEETHGRERGERSRVLSTTVTPVLL